MIVRLVWTPRARADIKNIYIDIASEQPKAAERYFGRFRHKVAMLAEHPRLGGRHPEIFPSARILVEAPYVILYETTPDTDEGDIATVEIVRVVDGRRNLQSVL
jgi:toxin ParE1/3/4